MKAVVFTLGCKVNSYESLCLMTGLKEIGYEVSDKLSFADLYIINTCAVTKEAEKKSRQAIARVRAFNKDAKIIVTGCASQCNPKSFINKDGVYLVTGALNKDKIFDYIDKSGIILDESKEYYQKYNSLKGVKSREFIKIQDGCNNFCSYCLIPYLRGRERSRNPKDVIEEISTLQSLEVVLTGINITSYNYEGVKLNNLIDMLSPFDIRIRLGSLEESVITKELLSSLSKLKDFAPHFHLSLQSGSNNVLKAMNRHYDRDEFLDSVKLIREYFPTVAITTDIIVGFPTETEEDFLDTIDLCKKADFADIHCFVYSSRPGTRASKLPQIEKSVALERLSRLEKIKFSERERFVKSFIDRELSVLCEEMVDGYTEGYSANYIRCYIKGDYVDKIVKVKGASLYKDGLLCEII